MKFGGTSVGSAVAISNVAEIIKKQYQKDQKIIVVTSALSGITNLLVSLTENIELLLIQNKNNLELNNQLVIEINNCYLSLSSGTNISHTNYEENAVITNLINKLYERHKVVLDELDNLLIDKNVTDKNEVNNVILNKLLSLVDKVCSAIKLQELSEITKESILAYGELLSSEILHFYLNNVGLETNKIDATDFFIYNKTDNTYAFENQDKVLFELEKHRIVLTQGFIAQNTNKQLTNIGRGGSDYSASLFSVEFNATELQIWTDVSGVKSADPKIVENPRTLASLSLKEIDTMAYWGAKVLYPSTISPTINSNINVKILNTFDFGKVFTEIVSTKKSEEQVSVKHNLLSIILKENTVLMSSHYNIHKSLISIFQNNKYFHLIDANVKLSPIVSENGDYCQDVYSIILVLNSQKINDFIRLQHAVSTVFLNYGLKNCDFSFFDNNNWNLMLFCFAKESNSLDTIKQVISKIHSILTSECVNLYTI